MVRVNMEFEVDGEKQLSRFFDMAGKEIEDFKPVFSEWAKDFRRTQHDVFRSEGAFEGRQRWAELSPRYREWKERNFPGATILKRTGRMWNSLVSEGHPDHISDYDESDFRIGTSVGYAIFHQRGTQFMPQRKVIELTQPQRLRWVQACRRTTWEQLQQEATLADIARRV